MKTAREVARGFFRDGRPMDNGRSQDDQDRLTRAIEDRDRELVEACAKLIRRHEGGAILEAEVLSLATCVACGGAGGFGRGDRNLPKVLRHRPLPPSSKGPDMTTPNLRDNAELVAQAAKLVKYACGPFGKLYTPEDIAERILDAVQAALTPEAAPEQPRLHECLNPSTQGAEHGPWCNPPAPASVPTPATCPECDGRGVVVMEGGQLRACTNRTCPSWTGSGWTWRGTAP